MADTTLRAPDFLSPGDTVVATPRTYAISPDGTIVVRDDDATDDLERLALHGFLPAKLQDKPAKAKADAEPPAPAAS